MPRTIPVNAFCVFILLALGAGCADSKPDTRDDCQDTSVGCEQQDAGTGSPDAGMPDAGVIPDAGEPDAGPPPPAPTLTEATQSASQATARQTVTFHVAAMDAQGRSLRFTWDASAGTLGHPEATGTTSDISWSAPQCVLWTSEAIITLTVTNDAQRSTTHAFTIAAPRCPGPVAAADFNSIALRDSGDVWGWGYNAYSAATGDGTTTHLRVPGHVPSIHHATAVSTSGGHTLVSLSDGTVWAWGNNANGELGDGTNFHRPTPVRVSEVTEVLSVAAGRDFSLALRSDGTVWAWGDNSLGQLGDGTVTPRRTPAPVPGLSNVTAISSNATHSLALKSDGTVWGWGENTQGELGNVSVEGTLFTPIQVAGLTGVIAISAGASHSLALRSDGTVWALGRNTEGQLGDGTTIRRTQPVQVVGVTGGKGVAAGSHHSLAVLKDGTVRAWGWNDDNQVGDGTFVQRNTAVQVPELTGVVAVFAGARHSLTLREDHTMWAFGSDSDGQLGDGPGSNGLAPVRVLLP